MWTREAFLQTSVGGLSALGLITLGLIGCSGEPAGADGTPAPPQKAARGGGERSPVADGLPPAGDADLEGTDGGQSGSGAAPDGAAGEAGAASASAEPFPLHGVALFHLVNIYSEPSSRSERIGVLRRGTRVRLGPPHEGRECREGRWHPIEPVGYVCSGRTMRVGEEPPPLAFAPQPPRLDTPTPYDYGRNRREGAPLYRKIPSAAQLRAEREYQATLAAERAAAAAGPPDGGVVEAPSDEGEEGDEEEDDEEDDRSRTGPIAQRLKRGFYVTMERTVIDDGRRWVRTSELNYVEAPAIYKRTVPEIEGTELGDALTLPIVITYRDAKSRRLNEKGRVVQGRVIDAFTPLPLLGETKLASETYYTIGDNELVASDRVRRIDPSDPPPEVSGDERWIDVNLDRQTLVAYEGVRPVYATLVSTGKQGFRTPAGTFHITSKFISTNMSDAPDGDEPYLIEDVPWTMYFSLAIALHGAFWHSHFGRERSHGCVNLAPADARWLFFWVGPELPPAWHGVSATEANPGTLVFLHE